MKKKQSPSTRSICWTKWIDPLNRNVDEVEYPGFHLKGGDNDLEIMSVEGMEEDSLDEAIDKEELYKIEPLRVISTPHGLMTLTEHSFASNNFDFWTMHCNFDVTPEVASLIENTPGVETFNIITPYRARLGFNRILLQSGAFDLTKIKQDVENSILSLDNKKIDLLLLEKFLLFDPKIYSTVEETLQNLSLANHWAVYVFPNGQMETFTSPEMTEELKDKFTLFIVMEELIGGVCISSED